MLEIAWMITIGVRCPRGNVAFSRGGGINHKSYSLAYGPHEIQKTCNNAQGVTMLKDGITAGMALAAFDICIELCFACYVISASRMPLPSTQLRDI